MKEKKKLIQISEEQKITCFWHHYYTPVFLQRPQNFLHKLLISEDHNHEMSIKGIRTHLLLVNIHQYLPKCFFDYKFFGEFSFFGENSKGSTGEIKLFSKMVVGE